MMSRNSRLRQPGDQATRPPALDRRAIRLRARASCATVSPYSEWWAAPCPPEIQGNPTLGIGGFRSKTATRKKTQTDRDQQRENASWTHRGRRGASASFQAGLIPIDGSLLSFVVGGRALLRARCRRPSRTRTRRRGFSGYGSRIRSWQSRACARIWGQCELTIRQIAVVE